MLLYTLYLHIYIYFNNKIFYLFIYFLHISSLIDYECITENGERGGKRLVSFGSLCGSAGMINTFRGLGERFLSLGYSTPFLNISSSYMYPNLK